jgi:transposase
MLSLPESVRIFLATEPTDMRKGFYSLSALVKKYGLDVYSGHLFVFVSRDRKKTKVLFWSRGGFVLYYKNLELGRFKTPRFKESSTTISLDGTQLSMLLDGIDYSRVSRPKRWKPPRS